MDELDIPLFPLNTIVFPGGLLKLKIFEQRYLDMTKRCIADQSGFGVIATQDDGVAYGVGTLVTVTEWDMPHTGIFALKTMGATRFVVREKWVEKDGLNRGRVTQIPDEDDVTLPAEFTHLAGLVEGIVARYGEDTFPQPLRLDSASWVSARLAEVMPLNLRIKQQLLEINDPVLRLKALSQFLSKQGIVSR
jgi:Lon protease-like protein